MTLDSRKPKRPHEDAGPISLQRVDAAPPVSARTISVDLPTVLPPPEAAPTFETVRIIPLFQLRTTLGRRLASSTRWVEASAERATEARRVVAIADALKSASAAAAPDIAVIRRAGTGAAIATVYSVLNGAVFMDADACGDWAEGREDAAFLHALANALTALRDQQMLQGGTRDLPPLSRREPLH
ncbi:hypothetical protein GCM10007036_43610 [Alsobacter metallidurans]|uniref:Uncharacterized protein n=1 Tax=Alsobacter metallidurans TaxID=340221 RepID=A0A917IC79_9HYPH|nr:hypothetical protein [Alsobacter metallidurans]GGH32022.1 hypothetical protein GCM10007036_43610 [Alsobacter metallidurans]